MANNKKNPSQKVEEAKKIANKSETQNIFSGIEESSLRFFRWVSALIDNILFTNKNPILLALLIAIVLYIFVGVTNQDFVTDITSSRSLTNVSVTTRYNSESFEIYGVPSSCDIILTGDAANVNNAAQKSGYCLLNLEGYTEGTHTVKLIASGYGDNVKATVSPSETQVTLERKTTAQFDLDYDFVNKNLLDSKYILGTPTFADDQTKVNIRASQETLNSISLVKALIDVSNQTQDFTVEAPLVAYNSKGQQVDAEIVPSSVTVSVKISSPSKTVPINLSITGTAPNGYALDTVSLDHQTTVIYASSSVLENIDEVTVSLDLSTITTNVDILQPINLPANVSKSDVTIVNIQLTLAESTTKEIDNVPIVYRNNENNLGASQVDTTKVKIIVTGTQRNIEDIEASDCVAYIDLKDKDGNLLEPGTYDLEVNVEKNTSAYVTFASDPNNINITLVSKG